MHLCGISYIEGPRKFFNDALDRKVQLKKFLLKKMALLFRNYKF
ncbi:Uncharacterised protein [Chlamydia trachomatis]|nr:Uncharacterised protein [Chlamydia trachomatis]